MATSPLPNLEDPQAVAAAQTLVHGRVQAEVQHPEDGVPRARLEGADGVPPPVPPLAVHHGETKTALLVERHHGVALLLQMLAGARRTPQVQDGEVQLQPLLKMRHGEIQLQLKMQVGGVRDSRPMAGMYRCASLCSSPPTLYL